MHWLECSLLLVTLSTFHWQNSAASTKLNTFEKNGSFEASKKHETNLKLTDSAEFEPIFTVKITGDSPTNLTEGSQESKNTTEVSKGVNITTGIQFNLESDQKREVTNVTFNDIKPLLLFPLLPFLFPPREKENQTSIISPENEKVKLDETTSKAKPFIFFDFAFIRRIPLNNTINNTTNDSNIINVKNLKISKADDSKSSIKSRKRRNTSIKLETPEFFDDSSLFPDSELDEFLPKSDLFFPDLPFHHHKPPKRLSRRKRDQKKPDLIQIQSDLKSLFDAFDEAFMQTKRELEQTDPILNFLRGAQPPFDDDKKKNIFGQISNIQEKPRMKWRIQRNIKRLKNDHQDGLRKVEDGPMIIVDKFVKIGEFHVPDEGGIDKDKLKKKKIENETKKLIGDEMTSFEKDDTFPKAIFDLKQEEKLKKTNYPVKLDVQNELKIQSNDIKIQPQTAVSDLLVPPSTTSEVNETAKDPNYGNLMKVIDNLKAKIKLKATNDEEPNEEKLNQKHSAYYEKFNSKKASYESLKKNITELLNQFLNLSKNTEDAKLLKRAEHEHEDPAGGFDWTEKETLLNSNTLEKNSRERRQKKESDFIDEYVDLSKKERQIADLNYLFLTVTLPTVFVFALVLLACFFSLQVKGKICSRLFRPRQVFIVEDEKLMDFKNTTDTKHRAI